MKYAKVKTVVFYGYQTIRYFVFFIFFCFSKFSVMSTHYFDIVAKNINRNWDLDLKYH